MKDDIFPSEEVKRENERLSSIIEALVNSHESDSRWKEASPAKKIDILLRDLTAIALMILNRASNDERSLELIFKDYYGAVGAFYAEFMSFMDNIDNIKEEIKKSGIKQ